MFLLKKIIFFPAIYVTNLQHYIYYISLKEAFHIYIWKVVHRYWLYICDWTILTDNIGQDLVWGIAGLLSFFFKLLNLIKESELLLKWHKKSMFIPDKLNLFYLMGHIQPIWSLSILDQQNSPFCRCKDI